MIYTKNMYSLKLLFVILPKLSLILAPHIYQIPYLYIRFVLFLAIEKISGRVRPGKFCFAYQGVSFKVTFFDGVLDVNLLADIFILKIYEINNIHNPKIVIDAGAHTGASTLYFHALYPGATIYAIEASKKNFDRLRDNVGPVEKIIPVHGALCDRSGTIDFFESKEATLGSSLIKKDEQDTKISVPAFTMNKFFTTQNIKFADFIKIDIEGSEDKLFKEERPESYGANYIIEVHRDLIETSIEDFESYFSEFNLRKIPLIPSIYFLIATPSSGDHSLSAN